VLGTRFVMNGECLIQCELYVGNLLLMEFLSACGPDSKSLNSVALYGNNLNETGTGVLVLSLLQVNSANVTGTSASTAPSEGMVKWELCLTLFGICGCYSSVAGDSSLLEH